MDQSWTAIDGQPSYMRRLSTTEDGRHRIEVGAFNLTGYAPGGHPVWEWVSFAAEHDGEKWVT